LEPKIGNHRTGVPQKKKGKGDTPWGGTGIYKVRWGKDQHQFFSQKMCCKGLKEEQGDSPEAGTTFH